jgi:hypothetical protein
MKTYIITTIIIAATFIFMGFYAEPNITCNAKALKDKTKESLDPYKYDSAEITRIMYKNKDGFKEIEVPLFIGEKYKVVFNIEALPKPIEISVYNKDKDSKNRTLLFSNKDKAFSEKQFSFEPSRTRHIYVDYSIPLADSSAASGCVVFMVGFK